MSASAVLVESSSPVVVLRSPLRVGAVDDPLETEADAVAERVLRMPDPRSGLVQQCPGGCPDEEVIRRQPMEEDEDELAQRQPLGYSSVCVSPVAASTGAVASRRGGGVPLPVATRRFFEPRFGVDLSAVRIHHDAAAAMLAARVHARAFTVAQDVFFGTREWAPGTSRGDRLIAHELTHTLQQTSAPRSRQGPITSDVRTAIRRVPAAAPSTLYTAVQGDSLSAIAGYPNAGWETKLEELLAANPDHPNIKGKSRSDPRFGWLEVGDKIHIPWGTCPQIMCPFAPTQPLRQPPPTGVPRFPQRRTIGPAQCRGACGGDCEPNNCRPAQPITYCHYDANSGCHAECHYTDVAMCYTHEACRVHDDCYDRCVAGGETNYCPRGQCHCGCDEDCRATHGLMTCGSWALGRRSAPADGEFFYTDTVTAQTRPGPCPVP